MARSIKDVYFRHAGTEATSNQSNTHTQDVHNDIALPVQENHPEFYNAIRSMLQGYFMAEYAQGIDVTQFGFIKDPSKPFFNLQIAAIPNDKCLAETVNQAVEKFCDTLLELAAHLQSDYLIIHGKTIGERNIVNFYAKDDDELLKFVEHLMKPYNISIKPFFTLQTSFPTCAKGTENTDELSLFMHPAYSLPHVQALGAIAKGISHTTDGYNLLH